MIFGLIMMTAVVWGLCTALREVAVYRSLVASQKVLIHAGEKASHSAELRHYEEIARIAERFNIEELKNRKKPEMKKSKLSGDGIEIEQSGESEVQAITLRLGLSGYLMAIPFGLFHGFFVMVTIGLAFLGMVSN